MDCLPFGLEELDIDPGVESLIEVDGEWIKCWVKKLRIFPKSNVCQFYIEFDSNPEHDRWVPTESIKLQELPEKMDVDFDPHLANSIAKQLGKELPPFEPQPSTKFRLIKHIQLNELKIETVYNSEYPTTNHFYAQLIYVCKYCLNYTYTELVYNFHKQVCKNRVPPGVNIYRNNGIALYEVDTIKYRSFCENLNMLAKPFIEMKNLLANIECFTYYTLYEETEYDRSLVGYFSKKNAICSKNLSCIMILPPYQKKGYGFLLVDISYELGKIEGRIGGPEYPLSDAGLNTYLKYWHYKVVSYMRPRHFYNVPLEDIVQGTGMLYNDVLRGLARAQIHKYLNSDRTAVTPIGPKIWHLIEYMSPNPKLPTDVQILKSMLPTRLSALPATSTSADSNA